MISQLVEYYFLTMLLMVIVKMGCFCRHGEIVFFLQEMKVLSAFRKNLINNLPIRVVRPENIGGQYAPLCGYRYDG